MQEQRDEIDTLRKNGVKFDTHRFLTLLFEKLLATTYPDFQPEVKLTRDQWSKDPCVINKNKVVAEFINLFTNFRANDGKWGKQVVNKDATIIALATIIKATKKATKPTKHIKGTPKSNNKHQGKGPPSWKCKKVLQFTTKLFVPGQINLRLHFFKGFASGSQGI